MKVSSYQANLIVNSLEDVINEKINYMSEDAIIIASSDKERIGQFHAGARKAIDTRDVVIINNDNEYEGAKKGINMPVFFESVIIGVIGVTGEAKIINKYAEIIKRMTEILVKEAYFERNSKLKVNNQRFFFESLISGQLKESHFIEKQASNLGIDLQIERVCLIFKIKSKDKDELYELSQKNLIDVHGKINFAVRDNDTIIIEESDSYIVFLSNEKFKEIEYSLKSLVTSLENKGGIEVTLGISSPFTGTYCLLDCYKEAKRCIQVVKYSQKQINYYKDLGIELFIANLSEEDKTDYLNKIFKGFDKETIQEWKNLISIYIEENGSIQSVSDRLFIHKNTLQYRLNRIYELSGYNPRNLNDLIVLYTALLIF